MLYVKNVPAWERALRIALGIALTAGGLLAWPGAAPGYLLAAGGAIAALTGFIGFCPMCFLAGRKLAPLKERA